MFVRREFMAYNKTNRLPTMVDPNEFKLNKNKASKEFLDKCKKAGKLFRHTVQEKRGKDE